MNNTLFCAIRLALVTCTFASVFIRANADSVFADVNGDRIQDEVVQSLPLQFTVSVSYSSGCYQQWNSYWRWWDPLFWNGESRTTFNVYFVPTVPSYCLSTTYVQMLVGFEADPKYTYRVIGEYNGGNSSPDLRGKSGMDFLNRSGWVYTTQNLMPLPVANNMRYWVVRFGRKGIQTAPEAGRMFTWQSGATVLNLTIDQAVAEINTLLNRNDLTPEQIEEIKEMIKRGCVGAAVYAGSRVTRFVGNSPRVVLQLPDEKVYDLPENNGGNPAVYGTVKAFRTKAAALAASCGTGFRTVIIAKYGVWKGGAAPANVPGGEADQIPNDSVVGERYTETVVDGKVVSRTEEFNYVTLINGKWVWITHRDLPGNPAAVEISDREPLPPDSPNKAIMWLRRCVPVDQTIQR